MIKKPKGKHEAPKRKISKSRSAQSVNLRNKLKLDTLFFVFLTFVLCFFYLGSVGIVDARNQEQAYLQREIERIETENDRLRLEIGYLDSLEIVEQRATEEMSMLQPVNDQCILISIASVTLEQSGLAKYPSLAEISGIGQEIPLISSAQQSISDILLRWNF
jgi:cell division protein FtsB